MQASLDDGSMEYHGTVTCRVENLRDLRRRPGVNLPSAERDLPAKCQKREKVHIKYGMAMDVDYVTASIHNASVSTRFDGT